MPDDVRRELDLIKARVLAEGYTRPPSLHPDYKKVFAKWRWSDPEYREAAKESRKAWYALNREAIIKKQEQYAKKNAERLRQYRQGRKEISAEIKRKWWVKDPEKRKAVNKAWRDKNRHVIRMHIALRRAREINATIGNPKEIAAWEKKWKSLPTNTCEWCRMEVPTSICEADHAEPLTCGGAHNLDNLVIACKPCNSRKRNKPLAKWLELLERDLDKLGRSE